MKNSGRFGFSPEFLKLRMSADPAPNGTGRSRTNFVFKIWCVDNLPHLLIHPSTHSLSVPLRNLRNQRLKNSCLFVAIFLRTMNLFFSLSSCSSWSKKCLCFLPFFLDFCLKFSAFSAFSAMKCDEFFLFFPLTFV